MPIREVADVAGAERYLRDQLIDGTTLAHLVLDRIDFRRGKFRIAMPDAIDQTPPFDFKSGIMRPDGDEEVLVARVLKSFIGDPHCAVLMQETQLEISDRYTDRYLREHGYEHLLAAYKEEIYWAVAGEQLANVTDDKMLSLVKSTSPNFSAFFYVGTMPPSKTLTDSDLEQILKGLVAVAVDALDFESFLVWWRDDLVPMPNGV
jgi:hypothetical protein